MMTTAEREAAIDFAQELRDQCIAIELTKERLARSRSVAPQHRDEIAEHFAAQRKAVGGTKRLYHPDQPEIKRIASVQSEATAVWKEATIAYRKGIRLLRKDRLDEWQETIERLQWKLAEAAVDADNHMEEILAASREWVGETLFDRGDYPSSFAATVSLGWSVHNFEPSDELLRLAPETYQREQERVRRQFEQALASFEQEMREQMQDLVGALVAKLDDASEGKKVVYSEAATKNLREFFDRFEKLGVFSDGDLTALIAEARETLGGTTMAELKNNATRRGELAAEFKAVQDKLGALIVDAPTRAIDLDDLDD